MPFSIEAVGSIGPGYHVAQLFHDANDAVDTLVQYFHRGLELNEFCLWVATEPMTVEMATRGLEQAVGDLGSYVDRGQLIIAGPEYWHSKGAPFDLFEWLRVLCEKSYSSGQNGFARMRFGQNVSSMTATEWANFITYELVVKRLVRRLSITTMSCFDLGRLETAELVDVVDSHSHTLCQRRSKWELIPNSSHCRTRLSIRGAGYASIGRLMGITRERARQLVTAKQPAGQKRRAMLPNDLLSTGDAALLLGVTDTTIARWGEVGILRMSRIGSRGDRRFKRADVNALVLRRQKS